MMDSNSLKAQLSRLQEAAEARDFDDIERQIREQFILRLMKIMDWKRKKAVDWMRFPNLNFGGTSPDVLIKMCRAHKVKLFIDAAEDENGLKETKKT